VRGALIVVYPVPRPQRTLIVISYIRRLQRGTSVQARAGEAPLHRLASIEALQDAPVAENNGGVALISGHGVPRPEHDSPVRIVGADVEFGHEAVPVRPARDGAAVKAIVPGRKYILAGMPSDEVNRADAKDRGLCQSLYLRDRRVLGEGRSQSGTSPCVHQP
jgi:hypothetical protein